jgi:hypothetical protein
VFRIIGWYFGFVYLFYETHIHMPSSFDMIMRRHVMIYDHEQSPFFKMGRGMFVL